MQKNNKSKLKKSDFYQTPRPFWEAMLDYLSIDEFSCDPCSPMVVEDYNIPAAIRYKEETNGLENEWGPVDGHILLNPPFSKGNFDNFVYKAISESRRGLIKVIAIYGKTLLINK